MYKSIIQSINHIELFKQLENYDTCTFICDTCMSNTVKQTLRCFKQRVLQASFQNTLSYLTWSRRFTSFSGHREKYFLSLLSYVCFDSTFRKWFAKMQQPFTLKQDKKFTRQSSKLQVELYILTIQRTLKKTEYVRLSLD